VDNLSKRSRKIESEREGKKDKEKIWGNAGEKNPWRSLEDGS